MKVYVAGPMTGIPQFNFPAFDAAANDLRAVGHDVHSPAEMDDPATRAEAMASPDGAPGSGSANGETWGDFLARDVKLIADGGIETIFVLPGWQKSRGARQETFTGKALCGLDVRRYDGNAPYADGGRVSALDLVIAWAGGLWGDVIDDLRDSLTGLLLGRRLS